MHMTYPGKDLLAQDAAGSREMAQRAAASAHGKWTEQTMAAGQTELTTEQKQNK